MSFVDLHRGQRAQAVGVRRGHLVDPEDHAVFRLLRDHLALLGMQHGQIGDHARGDDALVVVALEHHLPIVLIGVQLQRIHAQALGQRRNAANVADLRQGHGRARLEVHVRLALQKRVQRVAATRIVELVDHVEDLLLLVVRERLVVRDDRAQREHQAVGADAIAQGFQELVAAVFVGRLQGLDQRLASVRIADLAQAGRCLTRDLGVLVLHQL